MVLRLIEVSIHATLAGGDGKNYDVSVLRMWFLSTPPSRVATPLFVINLVPCRCFYPRHPRGWRRQTCYRSID